MPICIILSRVLNGPQAIAWKQNRHPAVVKLAFDIVGSAEETIAIIRGEPGSPEPPDPSHLPLYRDHRRVMRLMGQLSEPPHEPSDTGAVGFLIRVWLRCVFAYLRTPGELLLAARHGNPKALKELLRLDKASICEPRVAGHLVSIFHSGRPGMKARIAKALAGHPPRPRRRALKARMAAFVIGIATEDKQLTADNVQPPTVSDLRHLFDAIAQDAVGDQQRDTDLPEGDDAWRKAVRRAGTELGPFVRAAVAYPGWTKLAP